MRNVTAVILGGGRGTRLHPLTEERAKPGVGVAGKYRLIDIPISSCINSRIERIFVLTQFQSASLHRHIMQTYSFDVFSSGFVDVLAASQTPDGDKWFQGTADAVRASYRHISHYRADQFLILSGDHLYRMDYEKFVQRHRDMGADISIAAYPVPREDASRFGLMQADAEGWVTDFAEKPKDPAVIDRFRAPDGLFEEAEDGERYLASMGIYVFEPHVLRDMLHENPEATDFGHEIIPAAAKKHKIAVYPFSGYWRDIGTIGSFFEANLEMAQAEPPFRLYEPGWPIYTRERSLPPSRVIHSTIRDSMLVEGSDVTDAIIEDSILGARSIVRPGSTLRNVVMQGADYYDGEELFGDLPADPSTLPPLGIGRECQLDRVIIDKNARIGDGVVIRDHADTPDADGEGYVIRDGVTVIARGAVIRPGTCI